MLDTGLTSSAVDAIERDGFVLLPKLCDPDFLEHILTAARDRSDTVRRALGTAEIGIGSSAGFREIVQRSPGRWDIPAAQSEFGLDSAALPWWPLVTALLGIDAEHTFSGVVSSDPGSPAQYWHADSPHLATGHRPAHALNVLVALHDIPMAMGPTECARGSHRLTNHLRFPTLVCDELIYQHPNTSPESLAAAAKAATPEGQAEPMAAGSCLVFDDRLLHRGLANGSDSERHVAYFGYRRKGYAENTHFESVRSVFAVADAPESRAVEP